jgi:type II secretion system protein I
MKMMMSSNKPKTHIRGFTLLETLLSLSIFSIAIITIIEGVTLHLRAENLAENTTRAVVLAQNVVNEIRYTDTFADETKDGKFEGDDNNFSWLYEMKERDAGDLYDLKVVISWKDGMMEREHRVDTLVARREDYAGL